MHALDTMRALASKGEVITRDVIEDPPGFSNDFISTGLTIRDAARNFPRNELRTSTH